LKNTEVILSKKTTEKFYIYLAVYTKQERKIVVRFDNLLMCLLIDVSFNDAADSSEYVGYNGRKIGVMNWKGHERKQT